MRVRASAKMGGEVKGGLRQVQCLLVVLLAALELALHIVLSALDHISCGLDALAYLLDEARHGAVAP